MERIGILFLIDKLVYAGTQRHLVEVLKHINKVNFQPYLRYFYPLNAFDETTMMVNEVRKAGINVESLDFQRLYEFTAFKHFYHMVRFIRERKIKIVHTYQINANIFGTFIAKSAGAKVITTRRDLGGLSGSKRLTWFEQKIINSLVDLIIVNSRAIEKATCVRETLKGKPVKLIYNGVDLNKFDFRIWDPKKRPKIGFNIASTTPVLGIVSEIRSEIKGHRYLFQAIKILVDKYPDLKLLVIGEGSLKGMYKQYVENLGISVNVIFLGNRSDIANLLSIMNVFVMPSLSEGMSNAILEAMAMGLPVITTDVGGNPETVIHGKTGILVPPEDVHALVSAVDMLLSEPDLSKEMGLAGRRLAEERFDINKMIREMEEVYKDLFLQGR